MFGYYGPTLDGWSTTENRLEGSEFTPTYSGEVEYIRAHINVSKLPDAYDFNHGNYDYFPSTLNGDIQDWVRGQNFTLTGSGNYYVEYVSAYLNITDDVGRTMKAAIYNATSGDLIATSYNKTVFSSTVWDWENFYFEDTPVLTPGDYVYAVWSESAGTGDVWLWGNTTTSTHFGRYKNEIFDGTFPLTLNTVNREYRIYAKLHNFSRLC